MVAAVSTAPSPVNTPISALNGDADAAANGISLDSGPAGSGGSLFAALLQKHMGKQTAANETNTLDTALLADLTEGLEAAESEMVAADLSALLPFLEAAGLVAKDAAPVADQPVDAALQTATDPSLLPPGGESLAAPAILATAPPAVSIAVAGDALPAQPANPATQAIAPAMDQASTSASSANIAAATGADAGTGLLQPAAESMASAPSSFASQLSAAQNSLQGQTPGVQDKPNGEAMLQQPPGPSAQQSQQAGAAGAIQASERGAATPALAVPSPVGTPQWHQELGDHVVWMAGRMENRAELVLNPPQMGRIEVSLSVSGDQANAIFTSTNPTVRDALEASLPRLREVLADAGIQLGQAQVGAENPHQSAQQEKNGDNFGPGRDAALADAASSQSLIGGAQEPVELKMGRGLVDTFA
jgi:flagellar hook-length control protein FliK